MLAKVWVTINRYALLEPGDRVVVGISGGPDSVALLHVLLAVSQQLAVKLHVAHLNHMFRGAEAEEDAEFVRKLAGAWGVPVTVERVDVPAVVAKEGLSAQEAARQVRYRFFRQLKSDLGFTKIAVGHHADDQGETVILHLIRGSGLAGLGGMAPRRQDLIRPLLEVTRPDIEKYCLEHQLASRRDPSNEKTIYLRNKVRLKLIPLLKECNPAIMKTLGHLAAIVREEDAYMEKLARENREAIGWGETPETIFLPADEFSKVPAVLQRRMVRQCFRLLAAEGADLGFHQVEAVRKLAERNRVGGDRHLAGGLRVTRDYRNLKFYRTSNAVPDWQLFCHQLVLPGYTVLTALGLALRATVQDAKGGDLLPWNKPSWSDKEACLDMDKVAGPVYVRGRLPGDRFQPLGMQHTKKLHDFMIDRKIPRELRGHVPIVATEKDILWVAGHQIDERFRVGDSTNRILHLELLAGAG